MLPTPLSRRIARWSPSALLAALVALLGALATVLLALPTVTADAAPPQTTASVVRPVTADGTPAEGWTVERLGVKVDCDGSAMPAVDGGIAACFPTAVGLRACWASGPHHALCLQDAGTEQKLVRVRVHGAFPTATKPAVPEPLALHLADGQDCLLRIGGAWGAPKDHPNWIGHYSCTDGAVYAPAKSITGIDQRGPVWKVKVWDGKKTITKVRVVSASFVGTAETAPQ
ncbi:hypothetical protein GCM10022215_03640 [Nocardioides fonticola]|uniref:Uncharacterized protein n=1 Tax=Nocardioides fonticola TaxID=450363 RepID=A0ABP7XAF9_9ACTN